MPAPVIIVDYDPLWPRLFAEEKTRLTATIGPHILRVEHVGSTAVPGLAAKPIIDILIGLASLDNAPPCIAPLEKLDYIYVPEHEKDLPERRYFSKGRDNVEGASHHLHMVTLDGSFWQRHILFRDYLRAHPGVAADYGDLKRQLAEQYRDDRSAYTNAKTDFITRVEQQANLWFVRTWAER